MGSYTTNRPENGIIVLLKEGPLTISSMQRFNGRQPFETPLRNFRALIQHAAYEEHLQGPCVTGDREALESALRICYKRGWLKR